MSPWGRWILEHIDLSDLGYSGYLRRSEILETAAALWPMTHIPSWFAHVLLGVA